MFMRAFVYRFVYVGVVSLGVALGAAFHQPAALAAATPATEQTTVAFRAPLPVVTLSTIHVRADAVRSLAARTVRAADASTNVAVGVFAEPRSGGPVATIRLDMPYYSFGKMLPRVGKE